MGTGESSRLLGRASYPVRRAESPPNAVPRLGSGVPSPTIKSLVWELNPNFNLTGVACRCRYTNEAKAVGPLQVHGYEPRSLVGFPT